MYNFESGVEKELRGPRRKKHSGEFHLKGSSGESRSPQRKRQRLIKPFEKFRMQKFSIANIFDEKSAILDKDSQNFKNEETSPQFLVGHQSWIHRIQGNETVINGSDTTTIPKDFLTNYETMNACNIDSFNVTEDKWHERKIASFWTANLNEQDVVCRDI